MTRIRTTGLTRALQDAKHGRDFAARIACIRMVRGNDPREAADWLAVFAMRDQLAKELRLTLLEIQEAGL